MQDSLGTIAEGKIADLVLLDANPLTDIDNVRRIAAVMRDRKWIRERHRARPRKRDDRKKRRHVAWEQLGAREREILEVLFGRGEATAAEVRESLRSPPSYSRCAGCLRCWKKGYAKHRRDGLRYVYAANVSESSARTTTMRKLIDTFFGGSSARVVATLLDLLDAAADDVTIAELRRAVLASREEER